MMNRISIFTNITLCLLFIILGFIGVLNSNTADSASVFILLFILVAYGIFLFFDFVCYRILSFNKQKLPLPDWIKNYRKIIFALNIIAILTVLFMLVAATFAFFEDINHFPERQRPFYIAFLFLLLLSAITSIFNAVGYFKSVKENKDILNEYIDDIGAAL